MDCYLKVREVKFAPRVTFVTRPQHYLIPNYLTLSNLSISPSTLELYYLISILGPNLCSFIKLLTQMQNILPQVSAYCSCEKYSNFLPAILDQIQILRYLSCCSLLVNIYSISLLILTLFRNPRDRD